MEVEDLVKEHYGVGDLEAVLMAALEASGKDTAALTTADLSGVDQLHAGFRPATEHLLDRLEMSAGTRLLDVGCGVGGPARVAAERGALVTGIDITPGFVRTATALTARVGLADRATFETVSAGEIPHEARSFDRAMLIHVGMNVPDKAALFTEVRRVLTDEGLFAVYEQMRVGAGDLTYPLPWAVDERSSFVATPDEYVAALTAAGFTIIDTEDRTAATMGPPPGAPGGPGAARASGTSAAAAAGAAFPLSPAAIFGAEFMTRIANNMAATRAGDLGAVLILARAS